MAHDTNVGRHTAPSNWDHSSRALFADNGHGNVTVDSTPERRATFAVYLPVLERTADKKQRGLLSDKSVTPPVGLVAVG